MENGWHEMKRLIEHRLDSHELQLSMMNQKLDRIEIDIARLDERSSRKAAITGAVTGFLAGLSGWLK